MLVHAKLSSEVDMMAEIEEAGVIPTESQSEDNHPEVLAMSVVYGDERAVPPMGAMDVEAGLPMPANDESEDGWPKIGRRCSWLRMRVGDPELPQHADDVKRLTSIPAESCSDRCKAFCIRAILLTSLSFLVIGIIETLNEYIDTRFMSEVLGNLLKEKQVQISLALTSITILVMLGTISPLRGAFILATPEPVVGFREALKRSNGKLITLIKDIGIFSFFFYSKLLAEIGVMDAFWRAEKYRYFSLKLLCFVTYMFLTAMVGFREMPIPSRIVKAVIATLACMQVLPACLLLLGLVLFINNPSKDWLQFGLQPFMRLRNCLQLVGAYALAIPSVMIELDALLLKGAEPSSFTDVSLNLLVVSSMISFAAAAWNFAALDSYGYVWRRVSGIPTVIGVAPQASPAFACVYLFRLTSIVSRALLFGFVQFVFFEVFTIGGIHCGGVFLFAGDFLIQCVLVWRATSNWKKLPWGLANVFTVVEPLLHGGGPIATTNVQHWAIVHFIEFCAVLSALLAFDGRANGFQRINAVNSMLMWTFCTCSILQWPLFISLRTLFAYDLSADDTKPIVQLLTVGSQSKANMRINETSQLRHQPSVLFDAPDAADQRCPSILARAVWWPSLLQKGTFNGSWQALGDRGAAVVAALLRRSPECSNLWLEMNHIGDDGAACLADAVEHHLSLVWLDLDTNCITDVGAARLATALERRALQLPKLWLGHNPIYDVSIKARLRAAVGELAIDEIEEAEESDMPSIPFDSCSSSPSICVDSSSCSHCMSVDSNGSSVQTEFSNRSECSTSSA